MDKLNMNLEIAKRTAELSLEDTKGLTFIEALQKAKREFNKGGEKDD